MALPIIPVPTIIATIRSSTSGKFVIVEGNDDIVVYRVLINLYRNKGIKIIAAGCKDKVLEVFSTLEPTLHVNKAVFIVDQDSWIFTGIPSNYQHPRVLCTSGYSIENDVYFDKQLELLMKGTGVYTQFQNDLSSFLTWFALAITRFIHNTNPDGEKLRIHPTDFFTSSVSQANYCSLNSGEVFPQPMYNDLLINYGLKLRGKSLLALSIRALCSRSGAAKYNSKTIMEETAITGRGTYLNLLFSNVDALC